MACGQLAIYTGENVDVSVRWRERHYKINISVVKRVSVLGKLAGGALV